MMKTKRNICENCRTGRDAYKLDSRLPMCPYISNWKNNQCSFYDPIEPEKDGLLNKILGYLNLA